MKILNTQSHIRYTTWCRHIKAWLADHKYSLCDGCLIIGTFSICSVINNIQLHRLHEYPFYMGIFRPGLCSIVCGIVILTNSNQYLSFNIQKLQLQLKYYKSRNARLLHHWFCVFYSQNQCWNKCGRFWCLYFGPFSSRKSHNAENKGNWRKIQQLYNDFWQQSIHRRLRNIEAIPSTGKWLYCPTTDMHK